MPADALSTTFAALADPTRRAILARLAGGESSVLELAKPFDMTLPGISKHLKVLERAGLIARSRNAQWRPCRLAPAPLKDVAKWVDYYRKFWEQNFDRLEAYLKQLQAEQPSPKTVTKKPTQSKEKRRGRKKSSAKPHANELGRPRNRGRPNFQRPA
ncbi:MAG TPA: metalloregulator ArsR/SmtB family transcription factor [Pirellulales bacterium]|nr:metalloregulator ArsR/SmtB family transcription factor [Pirellulales bacterium]